MSYRTLTDDGTRRSTMAAALILALAALLALAAAQLDPADGMAGATDAPSAAAAAPEYIPDWRGNSGRVRPAE